MAMGLDRKPANEEEDMNRSLGQLCRRILDIDRQCSREKGCPADYAAFPMVEAWLKARGLKNFVDAPETIRRILTTGGDGRAWEIDDIQQYAREFLETPAS